MLSYAKVQNKPRVLQSLTGLSVAKFERLLVSFEQAWQGYIEEYYINQPRRRYGGGRSPQLKQTCDNLLFILVCFRLYTTQAGVIEAKILLANSSEKNQAILGLSSINRDCRVCAWGTSDSQASNRTKFRATVVRMCWRWVFANPT
jgi:hypothetical protein